MNKSACHNEQELHYLPNPQKLLLQERQGAPDLRGPHSLSETQDCMIKIIQLSSFTKKKTDIDRIALI